MIDSLAIARQKTPHLVAQPVYTLRLILLASLASSPLLHSVAHYIRLVIPWQALREA
jgi:hypothetical protein